MAFMTGFRSPEMEDPEEKRRRLTAEAMTAGGSQIGPDLPTLYDTGSLPEVPALSSADNVRAKSEAPDIEPPESKTRGTLDQYADWARRMPKRDDPSLKASTGRKILGGVVGALVGGLSQNPRIARDLTSNITNSKFNKANEEWEREGQALGRVAPLEVQSRRLDLTEEKEIGIAGRFDTRETRAGSEFTDRQKLAREKLESERDMLLVRESGLDDREKNRLAQLDRALASREKEGAANRAIKVSEGEKNRQAAGERQDKYLGARRLPVPPGSKKTLENMVMADPTYRRFVDDEGILDSSDVDEEDMEDYNRFISDFNRQRTSVGPVSNFGR